ncbi:MAG: biotin/lipoyl-binding protein [Bryobacterales bacterium]|nr:biotin/lipoyl-binding protein [Bryobacterales bacterium]
MKRIIAVNGRAGRIEMGRQGGEVRFSLTWEDAAGSVAGLCEAVEISPGRWSLLWEGRSFEAIVDGDAVLVNGTSFFAVARDPRDWSPADNHATGSGPAQIASAMPGKIVRLLVADGDPVEAGQGILTVEAMKMQNEMQAPRAGTVRLRAITSGGTVAAGEVLATIE